MLAAILLLGCPADDPDACTACESIGPSTRFARLTHAQWENAVADLLGLPGPTGLSESFIGDVLSEGGFDNDADLLSVSPELWSDYQRAAETLALDAVTDDGLYAALVPEDPGFAGPVGDPVRVEAESPEASATTGAAFGGAYMVWANGYLEAEFDFDEGEHELAAWVWGTQAGSEPVRAELRLDGVPLQAFDVPGDESAQAEIAVTTAVSAGTHAVQVAFLNDYVAPDGADRNLLVDWIEVRPGGEALPVDDADRDAWLQRIGRKAHRRPLSPAELGQYRALFDAGAGLELTGSPFKDGAYTTLLGMLQSPYFVYRAELSSIGDADGRIPLDDYELASKLAFTLWNRPPDEELSTAADNGEVSADLEGWAARMLADPRARATVDHFHHQLLNLDAYDNIFKDPDAFPGWSPALNAKMAEEARAYGRAAVFEGDSIFDFYTSPTSWVDRDLAPIYGLTSTSDTLVEVELDPTRRAGILTTSGFLASQAHAREIDSIHRGVFVNLRLLCSDLPPPPAVIPPLPPPEEGLSNRERVDRHTGDGTCGQGCHSNLINPVGFAFENYDALGRWQDDDAGPIDASGSFFFRDGTRWWTDPVGFAAAMGDSFDAHVCLVRNWMRFTHGREPTAQDEVLLQRLAARAKHEDLPIRDIVLDLVTADAFRYRSPQLDGEGTP